MGNYLEEAKALSAQITAWRRELHRRPETGLYLPETAAMVKRELLGMGIAAKTYEGHSGITAVIGRPQTEGGRTIAIRADMDALPIREETGLSFASENENMHACGHDSHTAVLLAAARLLKNHEGELNGRVKLIFQPAEEGPGGAKPMVEDGVLDGVDAILALHGGIMRNGANGDVSVSWGSTCAADDQVIISIQGKGGHGSTPDESVDPVAIATLIINNIQYIVSREVSPLASSVVTLASVEAGRGAFNIIPDTAVIRGTIRNTSPKVREFVFRRIVEIAKGTANMMRGSCTVEFVDGYPALINDRRMVESFLRSAEELIGKERVHMLEHGMMGGEDAAFFFEKVPGCYFFLTNPMECPADGKVYGPHHPKFCIDESVLYVGAGLFAKAASDWLLENKE